VPGTLPLVKSGKLRALAITSAHRFPLVPELPTLSEAGVAGYEMVGWNGLFAAKGTAQAIVDQLSETLIKTMLLAEVKSQMADLGAEPGGNSAREFSAFVKAESVRWGAIIRERGIRPE